MSDRDDLPRGARPRPTGLNLLSRRDLLRVMGYGGAAAATGGLLAACGTKAATKTTAQQTAATDRSTIDKTLNVSNWPLYIDVDSKDKNKHPTINAFEAATGVKVTYTEDVNDNNEFFGKVRNQLAAGQDTGRDLFVLTDWMAARMIRLGWVQAFDKANLPNFPKNLRSALASPGFDPKRDRTAPWQSGLTGIAYNKKVTGEVRTMTELLTRPDLKGKVTLLSEMRDTMGLVLLDMGKDPAKFTAAEFSAAVAVVQKAVDSGQVRKFTGNEYAQDLAKGNIAAATAWSGDIIQLQVDNPDIFFVTPDAGLMLWSDNMMIPNKAQHKINAEKWINFYYDPKVAAQLAAAVNYICPVQGAQQEMAKIDAQLATNELIFPTDATLSKTHIFANLTEAEEKQYEGEYQKLVGA
ncbi:MAG: polyamine ABC transporter substrate-binding protein [Actinomycetota bacterium]